MPRAASALVYDYLRVWMPQRGAQTLEILLLGGHCGPLLVIEHTPSEVSSRRGLAIAQRTAFEREAAQMCGYPGVAAVKPGLADLVQYGELVIRCRFALAICDSLDALVR